MTTPSPIAVTGASGFIGSWIVKLLLDEGATVHATVRNCNDESKVAHLKELAKNSKGRLHLFEADLLKPVGYALAFNSCEAVIHVASPFRVQGVKNPTKELIEPALTGTRNVLNSVNECPSVKRVVLTSSVAAIHCDAADHPDQPLNEDLWNETATAKYQPYSYSKTLAEREAWEMAKAQTRWKLITINPSFVMGPSLSNRVDGTSVDLMLQMLDGRGKSGLPALYLGVVDVRDVARAHVLAAGLPEAQGRHIVSNQVLSFPEIAATLRDIYGDQYPIPKSTVPKALMYLFGPLMGFSMRYVKRNIGVSLQIDNSKGRVALGLEYRPFRETLTDSVEQLERMGLIHARNKA